MGLKGNVSSLRELKSRLRRLPITSAASIASRSAPAITGLAAQDFSSGNTAYGSARPLSVDGEPLTLVRSGTAKIATRFIATGRDIRTALLPRYYKYLIGKYDVLPNGVLPRVWSSTIGDIARDVIEREVKG